MEDKEILFFEEQKPRQWWLQLLIISYAIFITYNVYLQLFHAVPVMDLNIPDWLLIVLWVLFAVIIPILFYKAKLTTQVKKDGIYVQFFPFHIQSIKITPEDIKEIEILTYNPLMDYGGWGVRYGKNGNALNVYGNRGVNIKLTYARDLLIGSQKPEELYNAINSILTKSS